MAPASRCACGAPRPRLCQPGGSSRGHVRRRTAPTPPRPTVSDRVQPGLDHPAVSRRGPTGPGRSALACDPSRRCLRTDPHRRRLATVDHAPQHYGVANPTTATPSCEAQRNSAQFQTRHTRPPRRAGRKTTDAAAPLDLARWSRAGLAPCDYQAGDCAGADRPAEPPVEGLVFGGQGVALSE